MNNNKFLDYEYHSLNSNSTTMEDNPIPCPAVRIGKSGSVKHGTIVGLRWVNGQPVTTFKEEKKPLLQRAIDFVCGGWKISIPMAPGIYPLTDVDPKKRTVKPQTQARLPNRSSSGSGYTSAVKDYSGRKLHLECPNFELEQLTPGQAVIWRNAYLAEIINVFVNYDRITSAESFYAYIKIVDGTREFTMDTNIRFFQDDGQMTAKLYVPARELLSLIDHVGYREEEEEESEDEEMQVHPNKDKEGAMVTSGEIQEKVEDEVPSPLLLAEPWSIDKVLRLARIAKGQKGIQGSQSSCYMDSSLFILFATNTLFDTMVTTNETEIGKILQRILLLLRETLYVGSQEMLKLRQCFQKIDELYGPGHLMDAEDFLLELFQQLQAPDFFTFTTGGGDYIHQIVPELTEGTSDLLHVKDTAKFIRESLGLHHITVTSKPSPAFILKLPFSDGKPFYGCKVFVPNLYFPFKYMDSSCHEMELFGILCLISSHYTCFVKAGDEESSPWLYFDSNPTKLEPKVDVLDNLAIDLAKLADDPSIVENPNSANTLEYPQHMKLISAYSYMLFYK